ncbi:autophagy-related protein [Achlya hypogyna]|uniref:Autophagy-related protein 2 n=1 Tax=Achlya hypogyna TaxID=1202772 RepID=A0A1V9ZLL8_ACHHY|nr:autophagy-related protein [Achlya hypogyna]
MFWSLSRLTEPALKRLYKFVLKRVLGQFLLHELDLNQLQVHLGQGTLHLVELELNTTAINALLATAGLPVQVKRGFLGSVRVQVSYTNLANESCMVEIDDVDLVLEPVSGGPPSPPSATPPRTPAATTPPVNDYEADEVSQEGLDFVATWIERVTSKIKITLSNVCISFEDPLHCPCALMLRLQWLEICDETPMDMTMNSSVSMAASTAALFGVLHKSIRVKGWRIELVHLQRDSMDNDWSDTDEPKASTASVMPILVSPAEHPTYIQIKQAQVPAQGLPDLDVDVFVHSISIVLLPAQITQLHDLVTTFTTPRTTSPFRAPPVASIYQSVCDQPPTWLQAPADEAADGAFTLSLAEFQRIEKLLQKYQQSHQDLRQSALLARDRPFAPPPHRPLRQISSAESVDSVGLSDLEDDDFHECTTGTSMLASSMYLSALPPPSAPDQHKVLTKLKLHVAQIDVALVYENVIDDDLPPNDATPALPDVDAHERLQLRLSDAVVQVALMPLWTSCSLAVPTLTLDELICPRLSLDAMDTGALLSSRIVQFHGTEKDLVVYVKVDEAGTVTCTVHCQPLQLEYDMYMLQRLTTILATIEGLGAPSPAPSTAPPMALEVHLPVVRVHVRFPLVPSDPIRFGPSSNRGNCEDVLVVELTKVTLTASGVVCDRLRVDLTYPPGGDQRALHRVTDTICDSRSMPQGVSIHVALQTPTAEELQAAQDVKAGLRDTFASDASMEKGHVGSDDGSEPGMQAQQLQAAAIAASTYHVTVTVPAATVTLAKASYDRLMILTEALLSINPVDITGLAPTTALRPCFLSLEVHLQEGDLLLQPAAAPAYRLAFNQAHVFQVTQWLGSLTSRLHVAVQDVSLFEGETPILYKTCWGVAKPSPVLLCLMETTEIAEDMRDIGVQLHLSHLTWRYDMAATWLADCLAVLLTEYPQAIVPLDTPTMATAAIDRAQVPVPLAAPPKTVFTKLMLQCYHGVIDYAPPGIDARALLVLGKTALSSNLVTDATVQGYKVSVAELGLFCHPARAPDVYALEDQWLRRTLARTDGSMQETVEHLGFLQVASLDMVDLFVRVSDAAGETQLQLELCLGTVQLKVCFDSFETLLLVGSTWWEEFASQEAPEAAEMESKAPERPLPLSPTGDRAPLNIMDQIDMHMFNKPTKAQCSDTEARLLHNQVREAKKPAKAAPAKPLVIEDFFATEKPPAADDNPWFTPVGPAAVASPVLHEASARWLPKDEGKPPASPTVASSFEAVDSGDDSDAGDTTLDELLTMSLSINDSEEVELEMNLDGDMRLELDRLLSEDAQEMTEDEDLSPKAASVVDMASPLASPTHDENTARWYDQDTTPPIYLHHVEIPISGTAAALSFGEKELAWAHQTLAKECARPMPAPVLLKSILLRDFNVQMRLFGGSDWATSSTPPKAPVPPAPAPPSRKTQHLLDALLDNYVDDHERSKAPRGRPATNRKTEEMLELRLSNLKLRLDLYEENVAQPLASNTVLHIGDLEVLDYISTSQIRKLLCYWKSDTLHPRQTGTPMFHLHLMTLRPDALQARPRAAPEEHRLKLKMLPLRINLDQDVLDFLKHFAPKGPTPAPVPATPPLASLQPPTLVLNEATTANSSDWFFQSVDVRAFKIKIDYRPQRVDYDALRAGDYIEVINLFVLEGMELTLRHIKLTGVDGWDSLGQQTLLSWVQDISRHQIHKCLASVVPMRSITNIGAGAADLILLPMAQYGKDRRVVRGLRKGAKSFLKSVTIETLNTASRVARGTKALLEHADEIIHDSQKRKKHSFNSRKGNTHARYLMSQPATASEGLSQAYASMSRELHVVAKTIVAVPLLEYQRTGSHGYVKSVIRAVPVAVLRPMIGATEAMSRAFIGVRNAVDPEIKEDMENKFKDMDN